MLVFVVLAISQRARQLQSLAALASGSISPVEAQSQESLLSTDVTMGDDQVNRKFPYDRATFSDGFARAFMSVVPDEKKYELS